MMIQCIFTIQSYVLPYQRKRTARKFHGYDIHESQNYEEFWKEANLDGRSAIYSFYYSNRANNETNTTRHHIS